MIQYMHQQMSGKLLVIKLHKQKAECFFSFPFNSDFVFLDHSATD